MKERLLIRTIKFLVVSCFAIMLLLPSVSFGDQAQYFYDETGRLSIVLYSNGTYLTYEYDAVGNLLSINKGTASANPPVISALNPNVLFIGSTMNAVISGQNLATTKAITCDNSFVSIKTFYISDTTIRAQLTVSSSASPAPVNFTVTTAYGSATVQATLSTSKLTFSPGQLAMSPGGSGTITASISPSIGQALTIRLSNDNPGATSVPQSITIPSSGSTTFTVNALQDGIATISAGTPTAVVFVSDPYAPPAGTTVFDMANAVSALIAAPISPESIPVSAYLNPPVAIQTPPVSALLNAPSGIQSFAVAAYLNNPSAVQSFSVSSVLEAPTQAGSSAVSAYLENDTEVVSQPVSAVISSQ
jgi:hypothetical protein